MDCGQHQERLEGGVRGVRANFLNPGDYPGQQPWAFTGTVKRVAVDVSGEVNIHLEVEAHTMLMRELRVQ
jgi:hypothetical protein